MSDKELVDKIVMFRTELERQNAGMGIMSLFDTICSYYGEQHRTIKSLQNENNYNSMLVESFRTQIDREQATIEEQNTLIESQKEEIEALHDALEMLPIKDIEIHERTGIKINETVSRLLIDAYQKEIESLKAITELAVKSLSEIHNLAKRFNFPAIEVIAETTLARIPNAQT